MKNSVQLDQTMPLRDLVTGLADIELPGHTEQLRALPRDGVAAADTA